VRAAHLSVMDSRPGSHYGAAGFMKSSNVAVTAIEIFGDMPSRPSPEFGLAVLLAWNTDLGSGIGS